MNRCTMREREKEMERNKTTHTRRFTSSGGNNAAITCSTALFRCCQQNDSLSCCLSVFLPLTVMMVRILMMVDQTRGEIVHPHVSRIIILSRLMLLWILRVERHGIILERVDSLCMSFRSNPTYNARTNIEITWGGWWRKWRIEDSGSSSHTTRWICAHHQTRWRRSRSIRSSIEHLMKRRRWRRWIGGERFRWWRGRANRRGEWSTSRWRRIVRLLSCFRSSILKPDLRKRDSSINTHVHPSSIIQHDMCARRFDDDETWHLLASLSLLPKEGPDVQVLSHSSSARLSDADFSLLFLSSEQLFETTHRDSDYKRRQREEKWKNVWAKWRWNASPTCEQASSNLDCRSLSPALKWTVLL